MGDASSMLGFPKTVGKLMGNESSSSHRRHHGLSPALSIGHSGLWLSVHRRLWTCRHLFGHASHACRESSCLLVVWPQLVTAQTSKKNFTPDEKKHPSYHAKT